MRKTILISIILLAVLAGCNKNKYNSIPSLKYVSVNTTHLQSLQTIQFKLSFTDKEGDISDSLTVIKQSLNCKQLGSAFTQQYPVPYFAATHNQSGDLLVTFIPGDITNKCAPFKNDTSVFKFVLMDLAKHTSDTATSEQIIIQ